MALMKTIVIVSKIYGACAQACAGEAALWDEFAMDACSLTRRDSRPIDSRSMKRERWDRPNEPDSASVG